ncbi:MAG: DUF488 domain-containing protein [Halofilum sp. (in: g-proteobacteria)]|nr:DUF488 domain-containing protein [Halofilum sp. (in: g-proteobacteria)]
MAVMTVRLKRIHDPAARDDGCRVLVDRVWPRGLRRADAAIDAWMREIAPSTELRKWFGHDPARWDEFRRRYHAELDARPELVAELRDRVAQGTVTLCYAARDREHNNAVALKEYLERSHAGS